MIYAEVAVSSRRPQRDPFTYTVPSQFTIAVGDGVFVPFGRQVLQGVVLGLAASTTIASPRPILAKIDDPAQLGAPLLTRAQVRAGAFDRRCVFGVAVPRRGALSAAEFRAQAGADAACGAFHRCECAERAERT